MVDSGHRTSSKAAHLPDAQRTSHSFPTERWPVTDAVSGTRPKAHTVHPAPGTLIRSQPSPVTNGGFHVRQGPSAHQPHRLPDGKRGTERRVLLQVTAHPRAFPIPRATRSPLPPPPRPWAQPLRLTPCPYSAPSGPHAQATTFFSSLPSPHAGSTGAQSGDSSASTTAKGAHLPTPHRLRPEDPPGSAQPNHTPDLPPPTLFLGRWNRHLACYPGQTCNP